MNKNIMKLPQSVANRIAAGEVIERPASMLKELLENAVDSGADNIEVSVEEAGIKSMIVEDNGNGIRFDELPLAITHHATSKIHSIEDLDSIYTLGFRGEALASISDVTNLEIVSKNIDEDNGGKIIVEGGKIIEHKPAAASQGTKIIAKNLFFNIPARYKFLKHISREFFLVKEVFDMEALVQPNISMKLKNNGKVVSSYIKVDSLKDRIENYLSDSNVFRNLIEIEIEKARKREEERKAAEARRLAEEKRLAEARAAEARRKEAARTETSGSKEEDAVITPATPKMDAYKVDSDDRTLVSSFEKNRGALPVPITGPYVIVGHYGQYDVPGLRNVRLDNKGIDIKGQAGANARAIFDGEVSAIFQYNGLTNVLVRHGNYISVYCNLQSVQVQKGSKIHTRDIIGKIHTNAEGNTILHFQLRKETAKLNPEVWIRR